MVYMKAEPSSTPVFILCGGLGTRLREQSEFVPKPMVPIGGRPILWHIMRSYAHHGFSRFGIDSQKIHWQAVARLSWLSYSPPGFPGTPE